MQYVLSGVYFALVSFCTEAGAFFRWFRSSLVYSASFPIVPGPSLRIFFVFSSAALVIVVEFGCLRGLTHFFGNYGLGSSAYRARSQSAPRFLWLEMLRGFC